MMRSNSGSTSGLPEAAVTDRPTPVRSTLPLFDKAGAGKVLDRYQVAIVDNADNPAADR